MPQKTGPEGLGRRIARLRAERGWTQQQLADRLAISRVAVSHLETGLSDPGERTVTLLAGLFRIEPHDLVAATSYPSAKAERLPVVVTRYTEVEHRLALLDADLAWLRRRPGAISAAETRDLISGWVDRLTALLAHTHDAAERQSVAEALRAVRDLAHG
jgi:transcriptional regulator with XRE-family HTH domain